MKGCEGFPHNLGGSLQPPYNLGCEVFFIGEMRDLTTLQPIYIEWEYIGKREEREKKRVYKEIYNREKEGYL